MKKIIEKNNRRSVLQITGNVRDVLEGRVTEKLLKPIEAGQFQFALGAGTFSNEMCAGETIVIEGQPHVSWAAHDKVLTQTGAHFKTPFLMGLDPHQKPAELFSYRPAAPISLQNFYEELALQNPSGFAMAGLAEASELHSTYLKKPPVYGENINEHQSAYWAEIPAETEKNLCFFCVVIPPEGKEKFPSKILQKGFYQNPRESKAAALLSHSHGAVLESNIPTPQNFSLKNLSVAAVRHILTSTLLKAGVFALFPLNDIKIQDQGDVS
jgi:hypothetical protein